MGQPAAAWPLLVLGTAPDLHDMGRSARRAVLVSGDMHPPGTARTYVERPCRLTTWLPPVLHACEWTFRLTLPDGWFTLGIDLPAPDRRGALARAVAAHVAAEPWLASHEVLLYDVGLAVAAEAVTTRALGAAAGFRRSGDDIVVMASTVHGIPCGRPADLNGLATAAAMPRVDDLTRRSVVLVDLPMGPAVRAHAIGRGSGARSPVEVVDHFVPVPGAHDILWLRCATPSVALGLEAVEVFDTMAASLSSTVKHPRGSKVDEMH